MGYIGLILLIGAFIGIFALNNAAGKSLGKKKRCPTCGNYGASPIGGGYYRNGQRGTDWVCSRCGSSFFG